MPRIVGGKSEGNANAITLYNHATPVPRAIRVYMFGDHGERERQPRAKNGAPPQSTTTVASSASPQRVMEPTGSGHIQPNKCGPMATTKTGSVNVTSSASRR